MGSSSTLVTPRAAYPVHDLLARHAGERAAEFFRHGGMVFGEAAYVGLVEDRLLPRDLGAAVAQPGERRIDDHAFRHVGRAVPFVERQVVAGLHLVAEHLGAPNQLTNMPFGIRVEQQLVSVEAVPGLGIPCTVHAVAVNGARPGIGQIAVPDLVGIFRQLDPLQLGTAFLVEQAQLHPGGIGGEQRKVDADTVPCGAKWVRQAFGDPGYLGHLKQLPTPWLQT